MTKYRAKHFTAYAIYRKSILFGQMSRLFKVALPTKHDAEHYLETYVKDHPWTSKSEFMIEEMPAIMKAWQP